MFSCIILRFFYLHGIIKLASFIVGNLSSEGSTTTDIPIKPTKTNNTLIILSPHTKI